MLDLAADTHAQCLECARQSLYFVSWISLYLRLLHVGVLLLGFVFSLLLITLDRVLLVLNETDNGVFL